MSSIRSCFRTNFGADTRARGAKTLEPLAPPIR